MEINRESIMEILLLEADIVHFIKENQHNVKKGDIVSRTILRNSSEEKLNDFILKYNIVLATDFLMDEYTIVVDYLFNRNKNAEEKDIIEFKEKLQILKEPQNFSNKQAAKFIRNAYCHNNDPKKSKFILDTDSSFKVDINNSEFIATFKLENLGKIIDYLINQARNAYYLNIEGCDDFQFDGDIDKQLENIYVEYYPLKHTFPKEVFRNLCRDNLDRSSKQAVWEASKKNKKILREQLKKEKSSEEYYQYKLDQHQKEKVKELIVKYIRDEDLLLPLKNGAHFYIRYMVQKVLPIPPCHLMRYQDIERDISKYISFNYSYLDLINDSKKNIFNEQNKIRYDKLTRRSIDTRKFYAEYRNYLRLKDIGEMESYAKVRYVKYFFSNLIHQEYINVKGKKYAVDKIRNSLVHFRWFFGEGDSIVLYDTNPNHQKMYKFNYCEKIDLNSLANECKRLFMITRQGEDKNITLMRKLEKFLKQVIVRIKGILK